LSFEKLSNWISRLKDKAAEDIIIILIGNKVDLVDKRVIDY